MTKRKRELNTTSKSSTYTQKTKQTVHPGARKVTVYDAVANRASYEGFVKSTLRKNVLGEKHRRSQITYPVDEVLGRRKHAPEGSIPYAEAEKEAGLPDSDLLIAIHQYASDFYTANGMGAASYHTLDETALLAVGMLLEETARTCLGDKGDFIFAESEEEPKENDFTEHEEGSPEDDGWQEESGGRSGHQP